MKKLLAICLSSLFCVTSYAQNLQVASSTGVIYSYPLETLGDIVVDGSAETFSIGKKVFPQSASYEMSLSDYSTKPNSVYVGYADGRVSVQVTGDIADKVSVKNVNGHVSVIQSDDVTEEITYHLYGTSSNGSFYMDGNLKATFILTDLTLHNPDSAAINIQDGKRIDILLNGNSRLSDGIRVADDGSDAHKACFYVDGHAEFSSSGTLTIDGNVKHAFASDEYTKFKSSMTGTVKVASAVGDAFHIGQYFMLNGGNVEILSAGDGIDVGAKKDTSAENNGQLIIAGGNVTARVTGGSSDALKCEGAFTMTGGNLNLIAAGDGGRLLSSDGKVSISGGLFSGAALGKVNAADEDRKAHGIKSDSDIVISGGEVYVAASQNKGTSFKTDYGFILNGGKVMGIGGKEVVPSNSSTKASKRYSSQRITGGTTVTYDGVSFAVPEGYNNTSAYVVVLP